MAPWPHQQRCAHRTARKGRQMNTLTRFDSRISTTKTQDEDPAERRAPSTVKGADPALAKGPLLTLPNGPALSPSKGGDSGEKRGRFHVKKGETRGRKEGDFGGALGRVSKASFAITPCQASFHSAQCVLSLCANHFRPPQAPPQASHQPLNQRPLHHRPGRLRRLPPAFRSCSSIDHSNIPRK